MSDRFQSIRDALAMGPTPGPWDGTDNSVSRLWSNGTTGIREYIALPDSAEDIDPNPANMHFIAACDPDTIRGLLAERDALAAEIERLREAMELARAVLAQSITAGHNVPGPIPEDIEKAFWALDAALASVKGDQA
jgi:hypothetical protein